HSELVAVLSLDLDVLPHLVHQSPLRIALQFPGDLACLDVLLQALRVCRRRRNRLLGSNEATAATVTAPAASAVALAVVPRQQPLLKLAKRGKIGSEAEAQRL